MTPTRVLTIKKVAAVLFALPLIWTILIMLYFLASNKLEVEMLVILGILLFALFWAYKMFRRQRGADKVIQYLSALFFALEVFTITVFSYQQYIQLGSFLIGMAICLLYGFTFYASRLKTDDRA